MMVLMVTGGSGGYWVLMGFNSEPSATTRTTSNKKTKKSVLAENAGFLDFFSKNHIFTKKRADTEPMSLVSENIKYLRKLNGLTQEQFARRIGIKRSLLGAYEEARANPNPNNLIAIAKAFNVSVENIQRHDLRKLRETPSLTMSFDRQAAQSRVDTTAPPRSMFADDDPFGDPPQTHRPDLADVPKPLASVLEKYYRNPTAVQPPAGPHIAGQNQVANPYSAPVPEPPVIRDPVVRDPVIRDPVSREQAIGGGMPRMEPVPVTKPSVSQDMPLVFNNSYEQAAGVPVVSEQPAVQPVPLVMQYQFSEYQQRHQQADFINRLPTMRLPTLPTGNYRAFEADADFVMPGALLVGQFIRNWFDIVDGRLYVLMLHHQGLVCRRIFNQVKVKGTLLLTADKATVASREVPLKDVLEVWEIRAFFSQQLPEPPPNQERLRQLVEELRFEVNRM